VFFGVTQMDLLPVHRLERYTLNHPQEVLIVHAEVDGEADELAIFKGYSSSLVHPTPVDLSVPVLPEEAVILRVDRLRAPYTPSSPTYIEQGVSWSEFSQRLQAVGL
jgi:hypothetical protein